MLPFPVSTNKDKSSYSYVNFNEEFIFSDALRQHYGKITANELTGCFQPSLITYVCKEEIPIYTYVPEADCEATLLHPSTIRVPDNCEHRFFKLSNTLWIPLHMSNQWLFVAPQGETFTALCPQKTTTLRLEKEGKLTFNSGCKGYSSYVTLYAVSTSVMNVTNDYVPSAPVIFDNCFEDMKDVPFENLPLHTPRVNVMSSVQDLRIASVKADEIEQMIRKQEAEYDQGIYRIATSWWTILSTMSLIIIFVLCSCCCCKCCRNCAFWLWDKWSPKDCWRQTKDKCCVNITNYNCPEVSYAKHDRPSPAISFRSLPEIESGASKDQDSTPKEKFEYVALRTRNKNSLR
jgi:hypothetical protein